MNGTFGREDIRSILKDVLASNRGLFGGTVFSKPAEPYAYDALADAQRRMIYDALKKYRAESFSAGQSARIASLASYTGTGQAGAALLQSMLALPMTEGFAQSILGHHGSTQAVSTLLNFSDAMAVARGGTVGSVLNQRRSQANLKLAAQEGGLAYSSFFNPDGSVNVRQTHGLSLPMSGYIAGSVLSERSAREGWARSVLSKPDGDGKYGGGLSKADVDNLVSGSGASQEAMKSWGEYSKKLMSEISGFVSSVSKLTGSYDETISFMQRMTGGDLFKDTEKARQSRDRAASLAVNMRLAAANAGMSPKELFELSGKFGTSAAMSAGLNASDIARGGKDAFESLAGMASMATARWKQVNRSATKEQETRFNLAVGDSLASYAGSEQDKLNVLAAKLKSFGMDMSEYESTLKSGDTAKSRSVLGKLVGNQNVEDYLDNAAEIENDRNAYRGDYENYSGKSFSYGRERYGMRIGRIKRFDSTMNTFAALASGGDMQKEAEIKGDIDRKYRDELLSDKALSVAGIDDPEERQKIRRELGDKTIQEISASLGERVGEGRMDMARNEAMRATASYAGTINPEMANTIMDKVGSFAYDLTEEDKNAARIDLAVAAENERLASVKTRALEGDSNALQELEQIGGDKARENGARNIAESVAKLVNRRLGTDNAEALRNAKNEFTGPDVGKMAEELAKSGEDLGSGASGFIQKAYDSYIDGFSGISDDQKAQMKATVAAALQEDGGKTSRDALALSLSRGVEADRSRIAEDKNALDGISDEDIFMRAVENMDNASASNKSTTLGSAAGRYDASGVISLRNKAQAGTSFTGHNPESAESRLAVLLASRADDAQAEANARSFGEGASSITSDAVSSVNNSVAPLLDAEKRIRAFLSEKAGSGKGLSDEEYAKYIKSDAGSKYLEEALKSDEDVGNLVKAGYTEQGIANTIKSLSESGGKGGSGQKDIARAGLLLDRFNSGTAKPEGSSGAGDSELLKEIVKVLNAISDTLKSGGVDSLERMLSY